ncbi:cytochrome P450 [Phyllosticta citribraziliensis]|uniref:Cytochrome P450 n=1 Tax=Phyllosticta citribraziliensis TaxID=989973 RepID=A0ABR1LHP2_9PEZI
MALLQNIFPFLLFAVISGALFLVYNQSVLYLHRRKVIRENGCEPPTAAKLLDPVLGIDNIITLARESRNHNLLGHISNRFKQYGQTYSTLRLGTPLIMTNEPANLQAVLATRFKDFALGPFRQPAMGHFLGKGIFTTDGAHWAASRAMIRPNFARDQVADLAMLESHVQDLLAVLPRDGHTEVDLQELFFRLTIDSATAFLFGKSADTLKEKLYSNDPAMTRQGAKFAAAFAAAQEECLSFVQMGPLAALLKCKAKVGDGELAVDVVHSYVDQFVDEAVRYRQSLDEKQHAFGAADSPKEDKYVFLHELAKQTTDKRRIRDELLNVLLAGRDTTASLLGNLFFVLARRPDVWAKLKQEIAVLDGRTPTYEELRGFRYLKWCLNESLRIHPVVPINTRLATADTMLPVGGGPSGTSPIFVKRGTAVVYCPFTLHRRRDVWGADADVFRPERWEGLKVGWEYLPFNGGPRICVGQQYALTEAGYATVRMVQEFEALEGCRGEEWHELVTLTLCGKGGCWVKLRGLGVGEPRA